MPDETVPAPEFLVSGSEVDTFMDCERRWWLTYVRRLRRRSFLGEPVGCAHEGTLIHDGLWRYYVDGFDQERVSQWMRARRNAECEAAADDPQRVLALGKAHDLAESVVSKYIEWAETEGVDAGLKFVAVEAELRMQVTERTTLRGKVDAFLVDEALRAYVVDHKTGANFTAEEWAEIRTQFLRYVLLAVVDESHGQDVRVDGVILNMLRRVKSAKTDQFRRTTIHFNDDQLNAAMRHLTRTVTRMEQTRDELADGLPGSDLAPRPSKDCSWICPFRTVCRSFDDGSDVEHVLMDAFEECDPDERYGDAA